ncbi:hypothetical protein H5410_004348 [Solanum commersonii]|uniref:Uncharacterized protein n=1 Tax=Solanum commersonii TaxID=4109 RepID=A0A9J6B875_SOLCO|nr:hypothetical protein H5410_004348 [Solanum commersonii]
MSFLFFPFDSVLIVVYCSDRNFEFKLNFIETEAEWEKKTLLPSFNRTIPLTDAHSHSDLASLLSTFQSSIHFTLYIS